MIAFIVTTGFCVLLTVLLFPFWFRQMKGLKRWLVAQQQLTMIIHHITMVLPWLVLSVDARFMVEAVASADGSWMVHQVIINHILQTISDIAYLYYCFVSLMYSVDVYMMICKPMQYAEFASWKNLLVYFLGGAGLSVVLSIDSMARTLLAPNGIPLPEDQKTGTLIIGEYVLHDWMFGLEILKMVKIVVLKVVYCVMTIKLAMWTKQGLNESLEISQNQRKQGLFQRLFYFTLIPIILNLIYTAYEFMSINAVYLRGYFPDISPDVRLIVALSIFSLGTLVYFVGFFLLFPGLRKTLLCQSEQEQ